VELFSASAQLGIVLHLVVAAGYHIVPAHHLRHSLAAYFVAAAANLTILRPHLQAPHSQVADTICRAHHDSERHSDYLVGQGRGIAGEQVRATAGRLVTRWERMFDLLWERRSPMVKAQLDVPRRWCRRCSSWFCR
jgi:hypothetical protein